MSRAKIKFLQTALDDLEEIVLYIALDSKENAIRFHDKLIATTHKLSDFPLIGVAVPDRLLKKQGYRMLIIDNYILFYKTIKDEILIMRILHAARDYSRVFADFNNSEN